MKSIINLLLVGVLVFSLLQVPLNVVAAAGQGAGGGTSSGSSGSSGSAGVGGGSGVQTGGTLQIDSSVQGTQDRDQLQDRDRIQDPSTYDGDEPDQDRDQIRDRTQDRINLEVESVSVPAGSANQLRLMIQNRETELNKEVSSTSKKVEQNAIRNSNQVRLAVHALLSAEDVIGGIGPQVSEIAQQINNSVQATVNAEASIRTRGVLANLFFGGDKDNASKIEAEVLQNQERIRQLNQIIASSTISSEVKNILQNQIQIMEQEQIRLSELANQEKNRWGVFSWRL